MMNNANLLIKIESPLFHTTEPAEAKAHASQYGGSVYTWKTNGKQNWLEKGFARSDAFMFVILPDQFPDTVDMLDDH